MEATKHVIVGTAGHIDHGKSALVEALTGTNPDRLEEEKRRGITIDLGFAFLDLGPARIGFVDVPGHERFVRNMLAGAGGIDVALLVVAADESIKPQTHEHFEICRLLGIGRGIVAITKCDLADPETAGLVRLEIEELARGSFLEGAPIVPVSARTGVGLEALKQELLRAAREAPARDATRHFRLPIDRSFAMKGFGTVVTGTLVSGSVSCGDEAELYPLGMRLRVRGLHSGGKAVERAVAGQRTAVNLAGIRHGEIRRGMTLGAPGVFQPTERLDARITLLGSAGPVKNRARVRFHQGTADAAAEIILLDRAELAPGESALAQLRLDAKILVLPGDRFILRQFSPAATIGGGVVIDPLAARHRRKDAEVVTFLETLERGSREEILLELARLRGSARHSGQPALSGGEDANRPSLPASRQAFVRAGEIHPAHPAGWGGGGVPGGARHGGMRGLTLAEIIARTGWTEAEVRAAAGKLAKAGQLRIFYQEGQGHLRGGDDANRPSFVRAGEIHPAHPAGWGGGGVPGQAGHDGQVGGEEDFAVASEEAVKEGAAAMAECVEAFHRANPLLPGIPKQELRGRAGNASEEIFEAALGDLERAGAVAVAGDLVRRAGREIALTSQEASAKEMIEREFERAGFAAPDFATVKEKLPVEAARAEKILQILLREKRLVKIAEGIVLHRTTVERLRGMVVQYRKERGERLAVPAFKELAGVTRKYAIPLLEYLDREHVTRRAGDERVILG
jgi:translation elongation factor TU